MTISHQFVNPKADGADATKSRPSDWNATHKVLFTVVEKDLGSTPVLGGTFDITGLSGLTTGKPVLIQQAVGPYTGKGPDEDEAELEQLTVTGYVLDATTIRCFWSTQWPVIGNFKFQYLVGT
jgi:hypothetical protein